MKSAEPFPEHTNVLTVGLKAPKGYNDFVGLNRSSFLGTSKRQGEREPLSLLLFPSASREGAAGTQLLSKLLVKVKILPKEVDTDLSEIHNQVASHLSEGMSIRSTKEEPIAFGLKALVVDFLVDEKDGATDDLENAIRKSDLVSEVQTLGVSRLSTKL
jgi:elongation factor 1-beta